MSLEMQNCLFEARITLSRINSVSKPKIADLVAAGRHVVISERPYYCQSTDAVAGTITQYCSDHETRAEALQAINGAYTAGQFDTDDYFSILPVQHSLAPFAEADDCPF